MQIREIRKKFGSSFFGVLQMGRKSRFVRRSRFWRRSGFRWKIDNKMEAGYNKNILDIFIILWD